MAGPRRHPVAGGGRFGYVFGTRHNRAVELEIGRVPRRPLAWVLRLLPILLPIALLGGPPARATDKLSRAATLHQDVHDHLDDPTLERRERAVLQMNEAIELDPEGRAGNHWALLAYVR